MSAPKKEIPELPGNKYYASNVLVSCLPDMLVCNIINFSEAKNNNFAYGYFTGLSPSVQ